MSTEDERKLFVAGLPDSMTEDVLRQLFEATGGQVVNVTLPKHRDTGRPRGFGFVTLATSEQAATARGQLDGSFQAGRAISVRPFQSEPPRRDSQRGGAGGDGAPMSQGGGNAGDRTLYVGNLPYDASQADIEQLFTNQGVTPVVRIHLPVGPDGRMRGFGFVTMGSAEAANQAIVALRGVEMKGRPLMVNIAHPRGERPTGGSGSYDRAPSSRRFDGPPSGGFGGGGGYGDFGPPPDPGAFRSDDRGGGDRRGGGGPSGPEYDSAKKKKKKRAKLESGAKQGRQNRKPWQDWDED